MAIDTIKSTAVLDGSITSDDLSYPLTGFSSTGIDDNADATSITIDSSEHVMVGTTTSTGFQSSSSATGTIAYSGGTIASNVSGDAAAYFNRLSSDGAIVSLRKNGSTVGNIGAYSGSLGVGQGDTGIGFFATDNIVFPSTATGVARDNAIDLGYTAGRFKDLYLSGGINFGGSVNSGGTVSSSNKLDDYEEGLWTPTVVVGSLTTGNAWYIKVGDMVTIAANCYNFGDRSSSQGVAIASVPFSNGSRASVGSFMGSNISSSVGYSSYIAGNDNKIYIYEAPNSGNYEQMKHSDLQTNADFYFCITYRV